MATFAVALGAPSLTAAIVDQNIPNDSTVENSIQNAHVAMPVIKTPMKR